MMSIGNGFHFILVFTLLICVVNITPVRQIRQSGSCTTPTSSAGTCINIRRCQILFNLLMTRGREPAIADLLRRSRCGFEGRDPKVCCPEYDSSTTTSTTITITTPTASTGDFSECGRNGNNSGVRIVGGQPAELVIQSCRMEFTYRREKWVLTAKITNYQWGDATDPRTGYHLISDATGADYKGDTINIRTGWLPMLPTPPGSGVVNKSSWPWMAALGYQSSSRRQVDFRCGGTLVTNRHVITASHCVTNLGSYRLTIVRLGDLNLNDAAPDGASPIDVPIASIQAHPQYLASPVTNDIAVLRLQTSVQFTRLIRPICLPTTPQLRTETFERRLPIIIGWGATAYRAPLTTILQQAQVPTVSNSICKQNYVAERGALIDERVICAGGNGNDTCQGDSGGPLIMPNGTKYYLIGVVSFGIRCAEPNYPGVYTRITYFLDWIQSNLT